MKIYHVRSTHYGPKSSHEATEAFIVAIDDDAMFSVLDGLVDGRFSDWDDDNDDGDESVEVGADWVRSNPGRLEAAAEAGLTVSPCAWDDNDKTVSGPYIALAKWWRGSPEEVEDAYYGATRYAWDEGKQITDDEAATLLRLGVAHG